MSHPTKDKGDLAVMVVATTLTSQGWSVCFPITEHASYDLIATNGRLIRRVQVKFRSSDNGTMKVWLRNSWGNSTRKTVRGEKYSIEEVDVFAITDGTKVAFVPLEKVQEKEQFTVRVAPSKNNQTRGCMFIEHFVMMV